MEQWIYRIELVLLVLALVRLQILAIRAGRGWTYLPFCGIAFVGGVLVLTRLGWDYVGQYGHMLFIAACLGLLMTKPSPVEARAGRPTADREAA